MFATHSVNVTTSVIFTIYVTQLSNISIDMSNLQEVGKSVLVGIASCGTTMHACEVVI